MAETRTKSEGIQSRFIFASAVIATLCIAIVLLVTPLRSSSVVQSFQNYPVSSLVPTLHSMTITNGTVRVEAGSYVAYSFIVPDRVSVAKVQGQFVTSGGSGNDIKVAILSRAEYVNWQNHHPVSAYYSSGKLTSGIIEADLPSGQAYYILYDNSFSVLTSKNVSTQVSLAYVS
jgi:hypothetical protein